MTLQRLRYRHPSNMWSSLSKVDLEVLDGLLGNEADMAYRRRAKILLDYLEISDGDRIIDLGCGMGFYLMAMGRIRELWRVGYDYDPLRLRQAQTENPNVNFVSGLVEDLPFSSGSFDKVLLSEVLEHLSNDVYGLKEIHRILKPGGILAISVPHMNYPFLWDPINRIRTGLGLNPLRSGPLVGIWTNHERLYTPDDLVSVLDQAGFEVEVIEESTHYSFPFSHFIVYGLGKPLLERNLLPRGMRTAADRFSADENPGSVLNLVNFGVSIFRSIDKLNDRPLVDNRNTFVNVLVKARKS
jgi:SAM-dependent methyltransferase